MQLRNQPISLLMRTSIIVVLLAFNGLGQVNVTLTLTPTSGQDAYFKSSTPALNQGSYQDIAAMVPNNGNVIRSAFEFDMTGIPAGATVIDARLSLYFNPNSINGTHAGNGANQSTLYRIIDPWNQNTVTWNTQPNYSTISAVNLSATTTSTEDFVQIDVSQMVQDMVSSPSTSHGFLFKLDVENQVRKLIFASGDNANGALRPTLEITYCDSFMDSDEPTAMPDISICDGDSTFLDILSGNLNDASDWYWYADSCGGTAIGNGMAVQVAPTTTTTYYVRGEGVCVNDGLCDSVIVNVNTSSTITESNGVLLCDVSGASYQWIDCNTNSEILGETSQDFIPQNNGEYAVITNVLGCQDTSNCIVYNSADILSHHSGLFSISPNPVVDKMYIKSPNNKGVELIIYSLSGEIQHTKQLQSIDTIIDVSDFVNGVYMISVNFEDSVLVREKIIINH